MQLCGITALWVGLAGAVEAPVTSVTVYSDRARVTRTATVNLAGVQTIEFPPLPDSVDPQSIRVEASGAEVRRAEVLPLDDDELVPDEARKLLSELEKVDDQLHQLRAEQAAWSAQSAALGRLSPAAPPEDDDRPRPKVSGAGWPAAAAFVSEQLAKAAAKERELVPKLHELETRRAVLADKAKLVGGARHRSGVLVRPLLAGNGAARVSVTYLVGRARWYPVYDLQLLPEAGRVAVSFAGLVSQETGEGWADARLTLSTAVPATSTLFPKVAAWKIGEKERFIPTPAKSVEMVRAAPASSPWPRDEPEAQRLRERLWAAVGAPSPEPELQTLETRAREATEEGGRSQPAVAATLERFKASYRDKMAKGDVAGAKQELERARQVVRNLEQTKQLGKRKERPGKSASRTYDFDDDRIEGELVAPGSTASRAFTTPEQPPAAAPAPREPPARPMGGVAHHRDYAAKVAARADADDEEADGRVAPASELSLSPPRSYRAPRFDPELPAAQAGGYDLSFASLRAETVASGKGARRVALFAETWPVNVERKVFPALADSAYLVAEIKSPSAQVLPGGTAQLFVGADPAGSAKLKLVSPGEAFTLPLGLDRAIKPVRNVKLVTSEKGFIGKDEITEYVVTTELANPYPTAIAVRVVDQWPVTQDKNVEVKLLDSKPAAVQDKLKGALEWRLTLPPSGKASVSFTYSIRRPKSWRMHQG